MRNFQKFCKSFDNSSPKSFYRKIYRATLTREWKHTYDIGPELSFQSNRGEWIGLLHQNGFSTSLSYPASVSQADKSGTDIAWIVASGPSINGLPLSKIKRGDVFAVNGSIRAVVDSGLSPKGSFIVDRDFFRNQAKLVDLCLSHSARCYFSAVGLNILLEAGQSQLLLDANLSLLDTVGHQALIPCRRKSESWSHWAERYPHLHVVNDDPLVGWSDDPNFGVFGGGTIVYAALQVLIAQGYRKIFILGMDMHFENRADRFYESGENARPSHLSRDMQSKIIPSFKCAVEAAEENGVELYNVTRGSGLSAEVVPWISFEEALSLAFSENQGN